MAVPLSVSQIEARKEKKIVEAKRGDTQINEQTLDDTKIASLSQKRPLHFDTDELFKMNFIDIPIKICFLKNRRGFVC